MEKALIVFVAVASVLLVAALMYFIRPQPCDGIFEQTAPQLKVKLGFIEANGAWAIGKEKIQEVAKDSQSVALHLKACCISQEKGFMKPEQFQVCVNGAKEYEAKIIQVTNIINEAQAAKQQGNTPLAVQKAAEAKSVAGESTNVAGKLSELAERTGPVAATVGEVPGAKLDVQEIKVSNGEVTMKFTVTNGSSQTLPSSTMAEHIHPTAAYNDVSGIYLVDTANNNKEYHVVRDSENQCLCSHDLDYFFPASVTHLWARFPAPPDNVQKVGVIIPHFNPMDGIPLAR